MSEDNGSWIPKEPGDKIEGRVVDLQPQQSKHKDEVYPILVIDTGSEQLAVHAFHKVLFNELDKREPQIGDEISITYGGLKEMGNGKSYHAYRVTGGQVTGGFKWSPKNSEGRREVEPDIPVEAPVAVPVADTSDVPF